MENHGETEIHESIELKEIIDVLQEPKKDGEEGKNNELVSDGGNFDHPANEENFVNEVHMDLEVAEENTNKTYEDYVTDALNEEVVEKIVVDDPLSEQDATTTDKGNEYVVAVVDRDGMEIFDQNVQYSQNSSEIIRISDSTNAAEEVATQDNNYSYEIEEGENIEILKLVDENEKVTEKNEDEETGGNIEVLRIVEDPSKAVETKDYRNAILEDWDIEVVPNSEEGESNKEISQNGEKVGPEENKKTETSTEQITNSELIKPILMEKAMDKSVNLMKYSNIVVTKKDIVDILDKSVERVERPIIPKKDIFFSIELTKRLNQKLGPTLAPKKNAEKESTSGKEAVNNNTADDHQKIVDILEADEIKDWKPVPDQKKLKSKDEGNDLDITQAILNMEKKNEVEKKKQPVPKERKSPAKRKRNIDKELERSIALQQLRDQFPSTRRKSKTTKKVNHIPFVASTVLEKALVSSEASEILKPATPKRRPCYLPEKPEEKKSPEEEKSEKPEEPGNKVRKRKLKKDEGINLDVRNSKAAEPIDLDLDNSTSSVSSSVVRTYSAKRKSTEAENEIKSTLQTIVAAAKEIMKESEEPAAESTPKKPKTVKKMKESIEEKLKSEEKLKQEEKVKPKKKKKKPAGDKKRNSELEKLLGDEGAIRMIYDTQQDGDVKKKKVRTTTGLKKDLMLKTKLVKNAVLRLSGVGAEGVSLRGKRKTKAETEVPNVSPTAAAASLSPPDPLFESTPTPNVIMFKPKKKQKAEASRILYRHSSSESFDDSSEGYRRKSFDVDGLNVSNVENAVNGEVTKENEEEPEGVVKEKPKRTKVVKRVKRLEPTKNLVPKEERNERMSTDSRSTSSSKLQLSNVPVRKSSRPRVVSKKYSIWASTSMDSLSVESLGIKKPKKASHEFAKKLNCKELIILQHGGLVQVVLAPVSTALKNSLNLDVLKELIKVLEFLSEQDSCKVVLLGSTGSTFCQGIDLSCLVPSDEVEETIPVDDLVESLRKFIKCLSEFKKVVIAGVQGGAVGLGVTILPYCDVVICSDIASFYTPYMKLGQVTEGVATVTFPRVNRLLVSELLYKSQKLTPSDALKYGLVTQILPEERFEEDLMLISRSIASQSWQSMQSIKSLLRRKERDEIEKGLELECDLLKEHWRSNDCVENMIKFMNSGELQLRQADSS